MTVRRWTDEMLDNLAESVSELREDVSELREGISELREGISEVKDSVDGIRITAQALLQIAAQHQSRMDEMAQRQAESDQRFNILLEEVRYLIRGKNKNNDEDHTL